MHNPVFLPLELWDEIAHFISPTSELLCLALVCRDLSTIVLLHHIHYRRIRCDISRNDIWEHLAKHRRRARGIRSVELIEEKQDKDGVHLPPSLINTTVPNATLNPSIISLFSSSLSHMIALEKFEWNAAPPEHMHDISRLLVDRAVCLRELAINFIRPRYDMGNEEESESNLSRHEDSLNSLPLWNLCNLTRVILNHIRDSAQEMLIHKCPNLEDLFLYGNSHCSAILETGTWPKLRRLTFKRPLIFFEHATFSRRNEIVINFFRRHANLESLYLSSSSFPSRPSRRNLSSLPDLEKLRSVNWNGHLTSKPSFFLSKSCFSRLVHYKAGPYEFDATFSMLSLVTLRLVLVNWLPSKLSQFFENAPNLKKLSLEGILNPMETQRLVEALNPNVMNVTHLYLSALELTDPPEFEKLIHDLSEILTLRYLQTSFDGSIAYAKIDRDPAGNYLRHRFIPFSARSEVGPDPSEWGDYFYEL